MNGFWIFMLMMNSLIPMIMILFGRSFLINTPKNINGLYGYRSTMSMKNSDTWEFAHKTCGRIWMRVGKALLIITIVLMILALLIESDTINKVMYYVIIMQVIVLVGAIIPVERELKRHFDRDGNRK